MGGRSTPFGAGRTGPVERLRGASAVGAEPAAEAWERALVCVHLGAFL